MIQAQPHVPNAAQGQPLPPLEPTAHTEVTRSSAPEQRSSEGLPHNVVHGPLSGTDPSGMTTPRSYIIGILWFSFLILIFLI